MSKPAIVAFNRNEPLVPWPDYPDSEVMAGDRTHRGRLLFDDQASGVRAGVWEAEANHGRWQVWPFDEYVHVLEGEVVMVEADRETLFVKGDHFIIPKGCRCIWNQLGYFRKFLVIAETPGASPANRPIIRIDPAARLMPSDPPSAAVLLTSPPTQHAHDFYCDPTGQLSIGIWDTTAYTRKLIDFPRHELMHLLEGSVTFTDDRGATRSFTAGDTFFVPMGTPNAWATAGYLKKIFVIFQPKA